eukprot:SAG31_NODE_669_length_12945_cov_4.141912_7_plen_84_part_00
MAVLFDMFGAWTQHARATALPVRFLDELLHAIDPAWLPGMAGLKEAAPWIVRAGRADETVLTFGQMLHLYIGSEVNLVSYSDF